MMHKRFSSTMDERFTTTKDTLDGIEEKLIKKPEANCAKY
jgi:hypothetical protein